MVRRTCMASSGLLYSRCTGTGRCLWLPCRWSMPCAWLTSATHTGAAGGGGVSRMMQGALGHIDATSPGPMHRCLAACCQGDTCRREDKLLQQQQHCCACLGPSYSTPLHRMQQHKRPRRSTHLSRWRQAASCHSHAYDPDEGGAML